MVLGISRCKTVSITGGGGCTNDATTEYRMVTSMYFEHFFLCQSIKSIFTLEVSKGKSIQLS